MPGHGHLVVRVPGLELRAQSADLSLGEVLGTDLQNVGADAAERLPGATAVAQGVLLHASADLIDDLPTEFHDAEGLEQGDHFEQFVANGVGIAVEQVQCLCADPFRGRLPMISQPVAVGRPGAPLTRSSSLAWGRPPSSRKWSMIPVTNPVLDGPTWRQTCSSTRRTFTPVSRSSAAS